MGVASLVSAREPLSETNTTPLIDVMLVLLVMVILTIPIATHSLQYELPGPDRCEMDCPDPVKNMIGVTQGGALAWNGEAVSDARLASLLAKVRRMAPEPEVQFRPDANAGYNRTAQALQIVKASRITRFGFIDNEKYREFSR